LVNTNPVIFTSGADFGKSLLTQLAINIGRLGLEETLVRSVIIKHLENQREKFLVQSGSGPDINFPDGPVLELKGSVFDWRVALEQFIRYAYTHSALKIALPNDALDLYRIQALASFEAGLKLHPKPPIRTYILGGSVRATSLVFGSSPR
jgi:hypothetical protein